MTHATKFYNKIRLVNLPDSFGEISYGYKNRTDLHVKDGFLTIVMPTITAFQQVDYNLKNGIADVEKGTFTYGVIDIPQQSIETKLENLRLEYSQRISDIQGMREAIERNIIDGTNIPNDILEQREVLKNEYNTKVNEISKSDS